MPEPTRRMLVVHADDLGLTTSFNRGIREAHQGGFLTSTSIRTNGAAFDEAVAEVLPECPELGVGVHLNVVEGRSELPAGARSPRVCDAHGGFRASFSSLMKAYLARDKATFDEVRAHYRSQIEMVLARGVRIDHLNSHQHSHAVPGVFSVVCELAAEYDIPFVRLPRERFSLGEGLAFHLGAWFPINVAKHLVLNTLAFRNDSIAKRAGIRTNDLFVGILYTGHVTEGTLRNGLRVLSSVRSAVAEILVHPCKTIDGEAEEYVAPYLDAYVHDPARAVELAAILATDMRRFIEYEGWALVSYRQLGRTLGLPLRGSQ